MDKPAFSSLCVYCGSRPGKDQRFQEAAQNLGTEIANAGLRLVFGGGENGLMGITATAARDAGGRVLGIIPRFLQEKEGLISGIESREVETMHERKIMMFEESDAFCVLPGGIGTLEEVIEVLSWASLDIHKKPIVLCNTADYWGPLVQLIDHMAAEDFAYPGLRDNLLVVDEPADVVEKVCKHLRTPRALM